MLNISYVKGYSHAKQRPPLSRLRIPGPPAGEGAPPGAEGISPFPSCGPDSDFPVKAFEQLTGKARMVIEPAFMQKPALSAGRSSAIRFPLVFFHPTPWPSPSPRRRPGHGRAAPDRSRNAEKKTHGVTPCAKEGRSDFVQESESAKKGIYLFPFHFWHRRQKWVPLPPSFIFSIGRPHLRQGSPSRPYTDSSH
ncbi:hypothetical protein Cdeb_02899 [Caldibacillus debilis GB1]|jgi:hypothetical protein|uniref:Uncharacterized protein n=1 Tax=Caldibacillus debilis GB1 TaxID=1339248 RepID=A0A420VJD3_9BACI|nr:hypothetical protein Cdeb_02899 [Caldibacillus debilis GB1]